MTSRSLLEVVQQFCKRTNIPAPSAVMESRDMQVQQIAALANEVCEELADRWNWQDLTIEATFTTLAGEDQGAIATLAPSGYRRITFDTIWNRTTRMPLYGPLGPTDWQQQKAMTLTGPYNQYRIRGGRLLFLPAGVIGQTCAFEYQSDNFVLGADTSLKPAFTADTDVFRLDDKLLILGLRYIWKREKGVEYAEDKARFEEAANNGSGRDGTKGMLDMNAGDCAFPGPAILIRAGNTVPN